MIPAHLAPGDTKSLEGDWSEIELHCVQSDTDPFFEMAFGALWEEFGSKGEMEQAGVIADRLKWHPLTPLNGASLRYALVLLTHRGEFVAVRDHTVIVLEGHHAAVVHMSHNLVAKDWRRSGIAGWSRALPVSTALECLADLKRPVDSPITLVGEMEALDKTKPDTQVRLTAYEKAGFKMVDPARVRYLQPDFRHPQEIDKSCGPIPVPLCLMLRRVGRENETSVSGGELLRVVRSLYRMYGVGFRESDMKVVLDSLNDYPAETDSIDLLPPTLA
jgi:GNAT superfamily N-acetyltransferase